MTNPILISDFEKYLNGMSMQQIAKASDRPVCSSETIRQRLHKLARIMNHPTRKHIGGEINHYRSTNFRAWVTENEAALRIKIDNLKGQKA